MNPRRITLFALVVLIAAALYFVMALTASADEYPPYLPPDPVAIPNTPLPPTPTPEGTIPVYGCHHPSMQNPPAPQAVWGRTDGKRINLHWSSGGGNPIWYEARFFQATHDENQSMPAISTGGYCTSKARQGATSTANIRSFG